MINRENKEQVLSDDVIVVLLKEAGSRSCGARWPNTGRHGHSVLSAAAAPEAAARLKTRRREEAGA
jgi:hypothetical protein